uniref:Protocadherin n=1 Tax=Octopus vulgaris TaxID=6645 RepID=A0A411DZ05_OCTVU|nr:protocadherin [Octopus vulgaris]
MFARVCLLLSWISAAVGFDIVYNTDEHETSNIFIGDIAADASKSLWSTTSEALTFIILKNKENSDLFIVTKEGKLYTAQPLDAESLCLYQLECYRTLEVAVRNKKSFIKILDVKITINDVNDNAPTFPSKHISLQFSERESEGAKIPVPAARDRDISEQNSLISYEFKENFKEPFQLSVSEEHGGNSRLAVILMEELDREVKDTYFVQVIAKDGGTPPKVGVLNIEIIVTDENDNAPIFAQNTYNISLNNTHQTDKPIVRLQASDIDAGRNGKVSYHFGTKTTPLAKLYFKLNNATGEVFLSNNISFNKKHKYLLYIDARDGGSPSMSSTAILQINIENQDNSSPSIELNFFSQTNEDTASISEDVDIGSFVAYVKVIDNDIGSNGQVSCQLEHDKFILQPLDDKKYKIVVKNAIDREANSYIDFNISCQDRGTPPKTAVRKISIQVTDINDVKPQFSQESFQFFTYENGEPDFPIGLINATDPDLGAGGQLTYYLMNSTENLLPFKISHFGYITTTQSLDREKQDRYRLVVVVKDNGTPSLRNTANVIVEIMDKNDNVPYFTFPGVDPFHLKVHYHPQRQKAITTLRAYDRDSQLNSFLQYEILGGNDKKLFSLDLYSGVMSFSRSVYKVDAGFYKLNLSVKDSGTPVLSTTTSLTLKLTVSNSTSKFSTSLHKLSTREIPINVMVIILVAAVIVSITIVVSITVCIVRRNHRREILYCERREQGQKFPNERRQSEYRCNPMPPQSDSQEVILTTHPGINSAVSQATISRKELYPQSTQKCSTLPFNRHNICHGTTQMPLHQTMTMPRDFQGREEMIISTNSLNEKPNRSYDTHDSSYNEWNTVLCEKLPGCRDESDIKLSNPPLHPKNDNVSSEGCSFVNNQSTNQSTADIIDLKLGRINPTDPPLSQKPWNLPMKNSFNCYSRPLPPIPKT